MTLQPNTIEQILALEAGDLNERNASVIRQAMAKNPEMAEMFESWKLIAALSKADDSIEPPASAVARAMQVPFTSAPATASQTEPSPLAAILEKIDSYVARLIHDDRVQTVALRSRVSENLHQVWEAGEFDIDIVAEHSREDGKGHWKIRGQVMSDDKLEGMPIALLLAGTSNVQTQGVLDEKGSFTFDIQAGTWGLRIGTPEKSVTLEPIAL